MGKEPKEILDDSLQKFAQAKELEDLADVLGDMMVAQDEEKKKG